MTSRSFAALLSVMLPVAFSAQACSSSSGGDAAPAGGGSGGSGAAGGPTRDEATAQAARAACTYKRGALPKDSLGSSTRIGKDVPIDTIVVVMMENHSFDQYFAHLGKFAGRTDIESAPEQTTNPDAAGKPVPWIHAPHLCTLDTNHEWKGTHTEYADGKMDGFVMANEGWDADKLKAGSDLALGSGQRALHWYDERDIPFYYQLAQTFSIADHYHSSILGPTWPNRMYLLSATSFGQAANTFPDISAYTYPDNPASILDELEKAKVTWNLYTDGLPGAGVVYSSAFVKRWDRNVKQGFSNFLSDAAAGTLPSVSFLDPHIGSEGPAQNDEHPPADVQVGQKFVSDVVHALFNSPQWAHTALFITWDEHGGYYDHLAPPAACPPDGLAPVLEAGDTTPGGFDRYGVRVPLILVSPYAKAAHTGHATYDHTSITRFIETRFELPALSGRDANADPLTDLFDFDKPAFATPPTIAEPMVDAAELSYCMATYGK
jgi:phospholipase C